jgi:phosphoribosyl 1,2-cyclic phosphodiesterase
VKPDTAHSGTALTVCVLASGSRGNAVYVSDGITSVLLDAGLSGKEIQRRMQQRGLEPSLLTALVVSHEHNDHVHGVGVLARRYGLPVYITRKTLRATAAHLGRVDRLEHFDCGTDFRIGELLLHPFSTSHDAVDPAGFSVRRNGVKIGIATDLGTAPAMVRHHLRDCRMVILEANHDTAMLERGPYPWSLKQRVKSRTGHLSNNASARLLQTVQHEGLEWVVLAHLSETNNTPALALDTVSRVISSCRLRLLVADQHRPGKVLSLR